MTPQELTFLCSFIRERSGIVLTSDKRYLVENRLRPILTRNGLANLSDLVSAIRGQRDEKLMREVVEAMTTNESLFFRDGKPFEILRDVVFPRLRDGKARRPVRIWSAACAAGQEPYSIAITAKECASAQPGISCDILATDIARSILDKARLGIYSQFEVQRGMPIRLLIKYFEQSGVQWQLKPEIRNCVRFQEQNILKDFSSLGSFDVIFCRNVLIYFDVDAKKDILERLAKSLSPEGTLFLGSSETVLGITDCLEPLASHRGAYRLRGVNSFYLRSVAGRSL